MKKTFNENVNEYTFSEVFTRKSGILWGGLKKKESFLPNQTFQQSGFNEMVKFEILKLKGVLCIVKDEIFLP